MGINRSVDCTRIKKRIPAKVLLREKLIDVWARGRFDPCMNRYTETLFLCIADFFPEHVMRKQSKQQFWFYINTGFQLRWKL